MVKEKLNLFWVYSKLSDIMESTINKGCGYVFIPNIDPSLDAHLYEQLYMYIKNCIEQGDLKKNQKLPPKRTLASNIGVSINTVTKAYNQLIDEGYITSKERSGFYVEGIENILVLKEKKSEDNLKELEKKQYRIDFSYNKVDLESFPFNSMRKISNQVINEYDETLLEMTHPKGLLELRNHIRSYIRDSRGIKTNLGNIIISSGTEYLFQILFQILDESLIYAVENPGYERISTLFEANEMHYNSISLDKDGIDINELQSSNSNIACITPSHQFPTGVVMPIKRRVDILHWANEEEERYIVEDDYDSEFKYKGRPIPPLKSLDQHDKVIYMGSFSKSLAPSLRLSYMVLPDSLRERFNNGLSYFQCTVPTTTQKIIANFIESGKFERHLNKMSRIYKKKREILVSALKENLPDCEVKGEEAGLHLLIEVEKKSTEETIESVVKAQGINITAISRCYSKKIEPSTNKRQFILGFGPIKSEDIDSNIKELAEVLNTID